MRKIKVFFAAMALLLCSAAFAQNITVKGQITDASTGETIPFAAVQLKGTSTGVASDMDGNYTISVPANGSLVFSSVGYVTAEVAVAGKAVQNVALNPDSQALEGVVVTAQGLTRKEKSIGYSTVKIDGEDLTIARQTDLGSSLAGKVSGARFFSDGGTSFDSGYIVLRGTSSYTDRRGSEPIYVVDGTITNKNAVNMDDVESINILKGPAATALYGSEGGNGAVIITTKGAKSGQTHVEFSHTTQMERFYNHYDLQSEYGGGSLALNSDYYDWGQNRETNGLVGVDLMSPKFLLGDDGGMVNPDGTYYYDFASDENWGPRFDKNVKVAGPLYYDETSSKYQQADPWVRQFEPKDLYKTGWSNTTNVAFSKAGAGYNTRISYTNSERTGVNYNTKAVRRYLTAKSMIQATPWLKASLDYKFTYRKNKNSGYGGYSDDGNYLDDMIQWGNANVNMLDYKDYLRPDGLWRTWNAKSPKNPVANFHDNPYGVMENHNRYVTEVWNVITGDLEASLPYNFKLGGKVMGNLKNYNREYKYAMGSINYDSEYSEEQYHTRDITLQGRLTWDGSFINDRLGINAAAFIEQKDYDYGDLKSNTNGGLSIDNYYNLAASSSVYSTSNTVTQYKTRAVFGNVTLAFDDTYFLDLNLRNDWDSRLPIAHNSYLYGGASASVMLSNFINAKWLNFWKLRASAAQVGSTLDAYKTTYVYTASDKYGATGTQYLPNTQLNPEIKPTISTSYEVGTEFKMFNNRFYGDINLYKKDITNQIMNTMVPTQSGFYYRQENAGLITNKGIEISLGGSIIDKKDWTWCVDANISKNINKLVKLNGDPTMNSIMIEGNSFYYYWYLRSNVGQPIGDITTMARWKRNDDGQYVFKKAGNYAYGNWRYVLEEEEHTVGNYQPDWIGGFSTSVRWKNFTLAASIDYQIGGQFVSWSNMWGTGSGMLASSSYINDKGVNIREPLSVGGGIHIKGVDQDGNPVDDYVPAYYYFHQQANYDLDNWIYDRTYVKLREVALTYQLPKSVIDRMNIGLSGASVSLNASNPWLIYSAAPNVDPSELGNNWLEGGSAASTRTFGATLKLMF